MVRSATLGIHVVGGVSLKACSKDEGKLLYYLTLCRTHILGQRKNVLHSFTSIVQRKLRLCIDINLEMVTKPVGKRAWL